MVNVNRMDMCLFCRPSTCPKEFRETGNGRMTIDGRLVNLSLVVVRRWVYVVVLQYSVLENRLRILVRWRLLLLVIR